MAVEIQSSHQYYITFLLPVAAEKQSNKIATDMEAY